MKNTKHTVSTGNLKLASVFFPISERQSDSFCTLPLFHKSRRHTATPSHKFIMHNGGIFNHFRGQGNSLEIRERSLRDGRMEEELNVTSFYLFTSRSIQSRTLYSVCYQNKKNISRPMFGARQEIRTKCAISI